MTDVVVIGGGLAGLVSARKLASVGAEVTLFEAEREVGGRVRSETQEGFTLDRGFQVLFTSYPAVRQELDLEALSLQRFKPGAVLARPGKRTVLSDPLRDPGALTQTLFNRDVTLFDKLRILSLRRELSQKPHAELFEQDSLSIEQALRKRGFSTSFVENFAAPFYGGITLDRSLSTSEFVFEYTFKMLSAGRIAVPAGGMGAISTQLASFARDQGVTIETGTSVESVSSAGEGVTVEAGGETLGADAAVVATDPSTARELTEVGSVPTGGKSSVTQHFALPETQALGAEKRLVLNTQDDSPNQIAPMSDVAPEYAPAGSQLLSATFLGESAESEGTLAETVRETLAGWYPENRFEELELLETHRIGFAQSRQEPGFLDARPDVAEPRGNVYLAGDYTSWSSIQGAIVSGKRAARAVLAGDEQKV